jgi:hypothetical protein
VYEEHRISCRGLRALLMQQVNGQLAMLLYMVALAPACMVSRLMQQAVARLGAATMLVSSAQRPGLLDQAHTAARSRLVEQLVRCWMLSRMHEYATMHTSEAWA